MNNLLPTWVFFFSLLLGTLNAQTVSGPVVSELEYELYERVMEYRAERRLPRIPLSRSLSIVAQTHVRDLEEQQPVRGQCNLHSWSNAGPWSKCCYTGSVESAPCMWDKPRELTSYPGNGYEIAYWSSDAATPAEALSGWKGSKGHNAVIVQKGLWKDTRWNAIGIGIYGSYAVIWFGEEPDAEGGPIVPLPQRTLDATRP